MLGPEPIKPQFTDFATAFISILFTEMSPAQRCQGENTILCRTQQLLVEHHRRQVKHMCTPHGLMCVASSCLPNGLELINSLLAAYYIDGLHTIVLGQGDHLASQHRGGSSLQQELSFGNVLLTQHAIDSHGADLHTGSSTLVDKVCDNCCKVCCA